MITQAQPFSHTHNYELSIFLSSSILFTLFLFFIDEGYYNFEWMSQIGNWIPFVIYVGVLFAMQLFFSKVVLRKVQGRKKILISIPVGMTLGMLTLVIFFLYVL